MYWLILDSVAQDIRERLKASPLASLEQCAKFTAEVEAARGDSPRNFSAAGDVAQITVEGVLTKKPDFWMSLFFGNTSYEDIIASLAKAEHDPTIKRVQLVVDSPGGAVDGLFEAIAAIEAFTKPITVRSSLAASAAYAIAAAAGKITAVDAASTFGSVGVVVSYVFWSDMERIDITSTEAPEKRPDPRTDEGKASIRKHLDALHDLFVDAIGRGRGKSKNEVNAEFGRGGVVLSGEAKKRGMIDAIATPAPRAGRKRAEAEAEPETTEPNAAPVAAQQKGSKKMDLQTLKAQHPDVYAAAFAEGKAEGSKSGSESALKTERERVEAFLTAGEKSGDMKSAIAAIRSGEEMTMTHLTKFMFAGRNKEDIDARQADSDNAGAVTDGATATEEPKDEGDQIADAMDALSGVEVK